DIIAGGRFTTAGGTAANSIARWNGTAWLPVGTGLNGVINSLLPLPTGEFIAGGSPFISGPPIIAGVARWGGTWLPLGPGLAGCQSMVLRPSGVIACAGSFQYTGSVVNAYLADWTPAGLAVLTQQPSSQIACAGGQSTFSILVAGSDPVLYR